MKINNAKDLNLIREQGLAKVLPKDKTRIMVSAGTCAVGCGSDELWRALEEELKSKNVPANLVKVGCFGICGREPLVGIRRPGEPLILLEQVNLHEAKDIVESLAAGRPFKEKVLARIESWDHITGEINYGTGYNDLPLWNEVEFFKGQRKIVLRNCGLINPEDIKEYIAVGGYGALSKALSGMPPLAVIEEVKKAKLRGRGGAGFPTGKKWEILKQAAGELKYIICNADEGDPGAFMNRNEMESDPHMLIEGMLIGAYACGAQEGIIYVRAEYPLAVERLSLAIAQAKEYGLLGENILGSNFSFNLNIVEGAGAFVCGEETSLIESIEGKAGRPRVRPPYPAQKGLWGRPTNINNVETWCNVAPIIYKGASWFSGMGTDKSAGTKVFSLVGKVKNTGLVEMPLGSKLKDIAYAIGGGSGNQNKKIKAIQTGGPSGGCIPEKLFDTAVDYESLAELGAIMGSGGMVVMDEDNCMVDIAKFFTEFTVSESCGKCVPCREGLYQLLRILTLITLREAQISDLDELEKLSQVIKDSSFCGLGQTAPNPVLSTLRYFRDEYLSHITDRKCPSKVCKAFVSYNIIEDKCVGCHICAKNCPAEAIIGEPKQKHTVIHGKCIKCGTCVDVCKVGAVSES